MAESRFDADVLIVGYGPTGVSAANFLGSRGVKAIAIERAKDIYSRARAVTVDDWTLRCFQAVGLDEALKADMDVTHSLRWVTYQGDELRRVAFAPRDLGHEPSYAIYQPLMEETLRRGADRYADCIEVRYGVEATDLVQDGEGVTATIRDLDTGASSRIRARYVLACDGGSSGTRERLGIALLGDTVDTRWVVIDAKVKRWWPNRHVLTFWSDKDRPVVDIALAGGNHRWELPLGPEESEDDFQTHEQLWRLLASMGVSPDHVEIHQHAFYRHHIRHAERWREGRVLLAGDAAHLMPPWAGQGMQSGVRDVYTLSWKLSAILDGRLPEAILDSYEAERAPDVAQWTAMAIGLGQIIKREVGEAERAAARQAGAGAPHAAPPAKAPSLKAGWLNGPVTEAGAVGKMIPQPRVAASNGRFTRLDTLIGDGFTLLGDGVDPRRHLSAQDRAGWDALGARYRTVLAPDQSSEDSSDIIDVGGGLIDWMRRHGAKVVAVRPDRFVAAADPGGLAVPATVAHVREPVDA